MIKGDTVRILWSCDNEDIVGHLGVVEEVEGNKVNVRFGDGTWWFCLDQDELEVTTLGGLS